MKKLIIGAFLLFLCGFLLSSTVTFVYDNGKPKIVDLKNGYSEVIFKNSVQSGKIGYPMLPYLPVKLLLPPGEIAKNVKIKKEDPVPIGIGYKLFPYQGVRPYSQATRNNLLKINKKIYSSALPFPKQPNKNFTTQFMNGFSILLSSFTPIKFIPKTGEIYFYKKITVIVETEPSIKAQNALNNLYINRNNFNKVKKFVSNPNKIFYYPQNKSRSNYDILLITSQNYSNDFDEYIQLYLKRGYITHIETVENINANTNGIDLQEKIRNYIIHEYQENGISFVTLAGDVEIIPYRGFYCQVQSSQVYTDNNIPADLYYSALDGTWNDDNDNLWGEAGEDDLLPDISVGRLSFSNHNELNKMLHKIISYQDTPVEGELQNPFMLGEHLWDDPQTWGGDYLDLLIGHHEDNGYTTDGIPTSDNIFKLYDRDLNDAWSPATMLSIINNGKSFIHHCGHSNVNYCMRLNSDDVTNNNFSSVNGVTHNYTIVYSHGCIAGAFDNDDCIAEKMVTIDNFALAFVGNSRYGWFNEGTTEGPSEHLHREFVNALYSDKIGNIGTAHMQSKIKSSWWVTAPGQHEEGALRWCFYDCNVLGDPVANVWTTEPMNINVNYPQTVELGENEINITISSSNGYLNNLRCSVIKNGELLGVGISDSTGNATITLSNINEPGDADLVIAGYNCKPTMFDITFIPPSGAYPYVSNCIINSGNDSNIDFGETAYPTLTITNSGNEEAQNVSLQLDCDDEFITVNQQQFDLDNISANGNTVFSDNQLYFTVSSNVPNNHEFSLNVIISYNNDMENTSVLNLIAYNANLFIENYQINNESGIWQPGTSVELVLTIKNNGASPLNNIQSLLSTDNPDVEIPNAQFSVSELSPNQSADFLYTIQSSNNLPYGSLVTFSNHITADNEFTTDIGFQVQAGLIEETFESGDFSSFDWHFSGNGNWVIDSSVHYQGNYSARSSSISNNQSAEIYITYTVGTTSAISFYKKVSSEDTFDFLNFYIDDVMMDSWSGEVDWSQSSYQVEAGEHTFKWVYQKDQYVSSGDDCAWIDNIVFPIPPLSETTENQITPAKIDIIAYPNPFVQNNFKSQGITIDFYIPNKEKSELTIYNLKGQLIKKEKFNRKGKIEYVWNLKNNNGVKVSSGVYFYKIKTKTKYKMRKITIIK